MTQTDPVTADRPSPASLASEARRQLRPPVPAPAELRDADLAAGPTVDAGPDPAADSARSRRCGPADAGMNTAEYAVGTLAAVAFAGILLKVLTSDSVQAALAGVIQRALG